MRRRTLFAGAVSAALAPALTGCGALSPGNDDPDTLVVHSMFTAGSEGARTFLALQRKFERRYPGKRIKNLYSGGTDLINVYETARLAEKEADVAITNLAEKTLDWTRLGATVPVQDYLRKWGLRDRVLPQALTEWTDAKGRTHGFPWAGFTWPVAYNTDLLREYGVDRIPQTTDELIRAGRQVRKRGGKGLVSIGGNDWSGQKLLMQIMQGYLEPARARRLFSRGGYVDDRDALRGLELFVELRDAGVFFRGAQGLNSNTMNTDFYTGQAPMISCISSTLVSVPEKIAKVTELGGWPVPEGGTYRRPTMMRGYTANGIWVSPNGTKKLDLVRKFVSVMYERSSAEQVVRDAGEVSALRADSDTPKYPLLGESVELAEPEVEFAVMPDLYVPPAVSQPLIRASSVAFTPGKSARTVAAALDTAYRS